MKKTNKFILSFLFIILFTLCFSSSAFAQKGITLKASNSSSGISLDWNDINNAGTYKIYRIADGEKKKKLISKTTESKLNDIKVKNATGYRYTVEVSSENLTSNEVYIKKLETPQITRYIHDTNGIKLTWSDAEGATSYRIYRRNAEGKEMKLIGKTNASSFSFTDKNTKGGKTYTYTVRACNSGSTSYRSNYITVQYLCPPEITKINSNLKSISVKWSRVPAAKKYLVYKNSSSDEGYTLYKKLSADTFSLTDKNVKSGVKYSYAVRAVDKNGKLSGYYPASSCYLLKRPKLTSASNTAEGISLKWTKSPKAQSYNLYKKSTDGKWEKILNTKELSATDKTAKNGESYTYRIKAVFEKAESACYENGFKARFLQAPQNVKYTYKQGKGNTLSWNKNNRATAYNIYRKPENAESWQRIGRTTKTTFTDKDVTPNKNYNYYIRAYIKNDVKSGSSKTVFATTVDPNGKMVAVTYDDGPSNTITNRILDTLEKYNSRATFFVIGSRIDYNYEPMQRAYKMGCEIGNHTFTHPYLPALNKKEIKSEIDKTSALVKKYTGAAPVLVRAPGGATNALSRKTVNMPFMYWSIDTRDWETLDSAAIIAHVKNETRDGSIILMHDVYTATAQASEVIIPWLVKEGYQLVTLSEIMRYRGIRLENGVTYYNAYK